MIFHNVDSVYVPLLYLYFLKNISPKKLNSFVWGATALARIQSALKSTKTFKRASWLLECFILEWIPRVRNNYIRAAYRLDPFPSLSAPTLIGWSKILERPSKNRSQLPSPAPHPLVDPNYPSGASNDGSDTLHDGPDVQDDGPNALSEDAPLDDHPNEIADPSGTGLNDTLDFDGPDVQNNEPYSPPEDAPLDDHPNVIADPSDFDLPNISNNDLGTSSAGSYDNSDCSAPALQRSERLRHPVTRWSPISLITL
ncbi:hypothetical protein Salat_1419800 [Sesamum alatum]|uniref:Uncharacterized protein n=1 Tax=Sesamum alatum TaxID=300844 RepID=A0AAE2CLF8_9LAMI|nr:hypothetical protein Salat_1419800 [Sesamum alatum]